MPPSAQTINPAKGLYIELGTSGTWENECIDSGILRFGYKETPFEAAVSGDGEAVRCRQNYRAPNKFMGRMTRYCLPANGR